MYKTELHLHNAAISRCAHADNNDIAAAYTAAGYNTVVLANHFNRYTMNAWQFPDYHSFVDAFCDAKDGLQADAGERLTVLLGAEFRFDGSDNDYLVFGVTRELLHQCEGCWEAGLKEFRTFADEHGLLVCQAHPFRNGMKVTNPALLDGVEVFNGHPGHDSRNFMAQHWAEHYGLISTSGSDRHDADHKPVGGILTEEPMHDMNSLVRTLRTGNYIYLCK